MYVPDNYDMFVQYEKEMERIERMESNEQKEQEDEAE